MPTAAIRCEASVIVTFNQRDFPADALTSCGIVISASRRASVRWPSVCAMGRPSRPRAFGLSATHDLFAPLRDAAAVLRASRALFWRTRGSPTITGRRIDVLAGGLRPPARTLRLPRAPRPRCALHGSVDGKQNGIVKFHHGAILIKVSDNAAGIPRRISGRLIRPQRHFAMG